MFLWPEFFLFQGVSAGDGGQIGSVTVVSLSFSYSGVTPTPFLSWGVATTLVPFILLPPPFHCVELKYLIP